METPSFHAYLGVRTERVEEGVVLASLDLLPHHTNQRGVAHGGVVAALLDTAMGLAVVSAIPKEWWCATTSLSIQFLEGARDELLTAEGRVVRRGKRVAFVAGSLRDGAGRLVATAHGAWHLWPHRPGAPDEAPSSVVVRGTGERLPVGKILAVGRNYAEHVREMGNPADALPVLFLKPPSALVADGGSVRIPPGAGQVHHEVELVVAIGAAGKNIPRERALEHVLGYAVGLDMTLRDLQTAAKEKGEPWDVAKGFDTSAPVSPVAPRDEVGDGSGLAIALAVNGAVRQHGTTSDMILGVPALLAYASRFMTLERGDLLFTGTPAGVGPVEPGDVMEATIEKVGTLRVDVRGEGA